MAELKQSMVAFAARALNAKRFESEREQLIMRRVVLNLGRAFAGALLTMSVAAGAVSAQSGPVPVDSGAAVKLGVMTDMTSPFSDAVGMGSVVAAELAVADVGGTVLGQPVTVIHADHGNKPDIGSNLARQWFDRENVDAVLDLPNSSVALAVQEIARGRGKILLFSGGGSSDLTGKFCSPTSVQWTYDTYALSNGTAANLTREGAKTWFFVTADNAFGLALERDATAAVKANGGSVVGSLRHPYGSSDMSSYLLQAQSSKSQVIGFANAGADLVNSLKQVREFQMATDGRKFVGMIVNIADVHGMGLETAQGLVMTEAFYWDLNDETRAFSKRFEEKVGLKPTLFQAGVYSSALHYLRAVEKVGSKNADAVMKMMRETPVNDMFAKNGHIREDGRMVHDMLLVQVKTPAESKGKWDYYKILKVLPAEDVTRPLDQGGCPYLQPRAPKP